jgi:WD40-like Beta Propeller Repeat
VLVFSLAARCQDGALEPRTHAVSSAWAAALGYSDWSPAISIELMSPGADASFNTPSLEGCPFISRDSKTFYMASTRPGGLGGIDIWASTRTHLDEPWGPPVNVGAPVNSEADDFCPTIDRDGHRFFFVSRRAIPGSCGGSDIYVTRFRTEGGFEQPVNLGCAVNSAFDEASPFPLPERGGGPVLYFSSTRPGLGSGGDLYRSESHGGVFGPAQLVPGVNSGFDDGQPNLRRDGLELFFYSTRPDPDALGGPDLYVATRASAEDPWSPPVNLGPDVNSPAGETRPSLSWDGTTLYFGSARPGSEAASVDIYVTSRDRIAD